MANKKVPTDPNQLASYLVQRATDDPDAFSQKNPAAVLLGRLGGLKGGKARAKRLSAKQRKDIARKAAMARWEK